MVNFINEMLAAIYIRNREDKKYSSNSGVLVISKIKITALFMAWTGVIITLVGRYLYKQHIILNLNYLSAAVVVLIYYLLINRFTWQINDVLIFIQEKDDPFFFKMRYKQFVYLTVIGFAVAGFIAYNNIWNLKV